MAKARGGALALLSVASVLGFVVTLYRNDSLLGLAHAAGLDAPYQRLEHALGSPGFGTPRSLDAIRYVPAVVTALVPPEATQVEAPAAPEKEEASAKAPAAADPEEKAGAPEPVRADARARPHAAAPLVKASAVTAPKAAAAPPSKHAAASAKHEDAEPKAAPKAVSLEEEPSNDSPPPEKHSASKKKDKEPEPKQDTAPALSLDDAIKASMEKKKH